MANIMWIASGESRSVRGPSHQPIFMGDCVAICQTYLPSLPGAWISFCVSGTAEVGANAAWMQAKAGLGYTLLSKDHATLGDGQMVTGGAGNRVGIGWPGSGDRKMGYCSWLVSCGLIRPSPRD